MSTKFSNILLDKLPKKINNNVEKIIDILFNINDIVRELNSIDFCNPLGYILTKSLPPGGIIENLLKKYGEKVTKFVNKKTEIFDISKDNSNLAKDIEDLRLLLEGLIIPEELKDIIPGADGITLLLQNVNDSLVITNTTLSLLDKKKLLISLSNRLTPFMNPTSLAEVLIANQAKSLNTSLRNIIKPERFRSSLMKLINLINQLDKSINQIKNVIILMNKIIKTINVLIKIYKISISIIKKLPIPAKYLTSGVIVTSSAKVNDFEKQIDDFDKILKQISLFIENSVINQIERIRKQIFILLIGLNQLYINLSSCPYFTNDILLENIQKGIKTLDDNILLLEELFPTSNNNINNLYKGLKISIIKEETTDNNTSLYRKRVIVTNFQDIIEYEGTPTYANDDQVLIKEGEYYIDSKYEINTYDNGTNNITDEETSILLNQIGLDSVTEEEASSKEKEIQNILYEQIQNSPDDKKIYDSLDINNSNTKVEQIKKIIISISKHYIDLDKPKLLQNRLNLLFKSLLSKGYNFEDIQSAAQSSFKDIYNITIINNNITINKI